MNKKLKFIVAGVAIVAGLASAVSCQDLSKDVEDLGKRVSTLENTVKDLQTKIDAGAVITSVTSTATGVKVTLSNGNSFDIANGKDGANGTNGKDGKDGKDGVDGTPGSVVTIGENGNWFIDGVDTGLAVAGKDGKDGKDGDSIVWAIEDGKFVEYKNGVATGNTKEITAEGIIKAIWDDEAGTITFYGVEGLEEGYVIYTNATAPAAISIVEAYTGTVFGKTQGRNLAENNSLNLVFRNVIEKANVFEENIENAITFEEGRQTPIGATLVVRVSPANYNLQAEDICFVNSLGEVYENVVAKEVAPYYGLLTKGYTETGLWTVYVELDNYDANEFNAATKFVYSLTGAWRPIAFAVKAQDAVSSYDLTFNYENFVPSRVLDLFVGDEHINDLNNRYKGDYTTNNPSLQKGGKTMYEDYTWTASTAKVPTPAVEPVLKPADKKNVQVDAADNRGTKPVYKAVLGEPIPVTAVVYNTLDGKYYDDTNVAGIYVSYDFEENAIESAPSEWNAWTSYASGIDGLNVVFEGNTAIITINDKRADGDIIGFRVYAVNADGTLLDPDGRAFYVQVGKAGTDLSGISTVMSTIEQFQAKKSGVASADLKKISAKSWSFAMGGKLLDGSNIAGKFYLLNKDDGKIVEAAAPKVDKTDFASDTDLSTIKKAYFETTTDLWKYVDDYTYEGEFTFYNADGFVVATLPVSFTKTLPASIAEVPVKTAQLDADGIYHCFLVPSSWNAYDKIADAETAGQKGTMDMLSIFNFPKDDPNGYEITFAGATKVTKDGKLVPADVTVKPTKKLSEDTALNAAENQIEIKYLDIIDNTTQHNTTVVYNMGKVSSAKVAWNANGTIKSIGDYTLNAGNFPTIFTCIYNKDAKLGFTWNWDMTKTDYDGLFVPEDGYFDAKSGKIVKALVPGIIYEDFDGKTVTPSFIAGKSLWDAKYKGTMPTGYSNSIKVQDVKLVTAEGANKGKVEYYNVDTAFKFTKKSGATNPTANVPSTLVITYTDMYGHKETAEMPMKVMPRK